LQWFVKVVLEEGHTLGFVVKEIPDAGAHADRFRRAPASAAGR